MRDIVVTGGSGKAGQAVVRDLLDHGFRVLNVDSVAPTEKLCPFLKVDLSDFGQAIDALRAAAGVGDHPFRQFERAEAVIHLAAIRAPDLAPEEVTFRNNVLTTYNVFSAATLLGLPRVVWASSETTLGLPFSRVQPAFAPITEAHPLLPESGYALSKVLSEEMARQMHRWNPATSFIGLRISNVMNPEEYANFAAWQADAQIRKWNLWSYVDARDVAQACRLSLTCDFKGADHFIIAAADTVMERANAELMAEVFPAVPLAQQVGSFDTLLSIDKARAVLGYAPAYSWREAVSKT
ncbi:MAG: NAD(P)-dependent oxidoreductase [Pseudomonadota bacterium]|nr:NAD(P)-dependent oxidoreductase [Pseudomonadota bacterium]